MEKIDRVSNLPEEILLLILMKVEVKGLIQLIYVSKLFKTHITRPEFIRNHTVGATCSDQFFLSVEQYDFYYSSSLDPSRLIPIRTPFTLLSPLFRLIGTSRGVVCLIDFDQVNNLVIPILWNPSIARFNIVSPVKRPSFFETGFTSVFSGFGFDHVNKGYKLVMIFYEYKDDDDDEFHTHALVYGTKTRSWKMIDQRVPCILNYYRENSVFVNGVVYWLAFKSLKSEHHDRIMGFDVVNEVFKEIELPPPQEHWKNYELSTSPDGEHLALSKLTEDKNSGVSTLSSAWLRIDESWREQLYARPGVINSKMKQFQEQAEISTKLTCQHGSVLMRVRPDQVQNLSSCVLTGMDYISRYTPSLAFLLHRYNHIKLPRVAESKDGNRKKRARMG